jgi:hypothetical protein
MRTRLDEARVVIPHFKEIWETFKSYMLARLEYDPKISGDYYIWKFTIPKITPPNGAFFNNMSITAYIYILRDESNYSKLDSTFNEGEASRQVKLAKNGNLENVALTFKIASSVNRFFYDIYPEFSHELTHAYEFYQALKSGATPESIIDSGSYDVTLLRRILNDSRFSALEKNLAMMYYYFDTSEYNGRMGSFYGEVKGIGTLSRSNVDNIIFNTRTWKNIENLGSVIPYMNAVTAPQEQQKLIVIGNVMAKRTRTSDYANYAELVQDVTTKYNTLKRNSYNDFKDIVMDIINNGA